MKDLLNEVNALTLKEYERAAKVNGDTFNSPHETYAVILEEFEEATENLEEFDDAFKAYWSCVKKNDRTSQKDQLIYMHHYAISAAAEMIQVAAMCHKALKGFEKP